MDLSSTLHVLKNERDFHTIGVYDNPEFGWNFGTLIEGFKAVICLFSVIVPITSVYDTLLKGIITYPSSNIRKD